VLEENKVGDSRPDLPSWITVEGETPRRRIDLSGMTTEAMLHEQMRDTAQRKGVPLKHFDPNWRPKRQKGEKIDRDSEAHQQAVKACMRGLPPFSEITWSEIQLFDNGPGDGRSNHVQYRLKFTATSAAAGALIAPGTDKRALSADQYCSLATAKRFRANMLRKKERHALTPEEWGLVDKMKAEVGTVVADMPGSPEPLFGALFFPLHGEGILRTPGQFASVIWIPSGGEWAPVVALYQYFRH
jgi:hypothetical protein